MSKSQSILMAVLMLILTGFVGFMTWRLSSLQEQLDLLSASKLGQEVSKKDLADEIEKLKTKMASQQKDLDEFSTKIGTVSATLKKDLRREFIPHPEYASPERLFTAEKIDDTHLKVIGDLSEIAKWEEHNKLFLDFILQESLIMDFDPSRLRVVVTDIIPDSIFYQMGLRKDDAIETLGGQYVNSGDELRVRLMDPDPVLLVVNRDGTKLNFDITYAAHNPNQIRLDLTRHEFNALQSDLFKGFTIAPALKDGKAIGVLVVSVASDNIFSLMGFKAEDVITEVDGVAVNDSNLAKVLDGESLNINICFTRGEVEKTIFVSFIQ